MSVLKASLSSVFLTILSVQVFIAQPVSANEAVSIVVAEASDTKVQKASKNIISQIEKSIDKETPEAFTILLENMKSNNEAALKLTHSIGTQNKEEVNSLLTSLAKANMHIEYHDVDSDILQFKLCANFNGVRHCFPSQRNSMKCVKF